VLNAQNFQNTIPKAGDRYFRCRHEGSPELFLLDQSSHGYWDFSFLRTYYSINETYSKKEAGKNASKFNQANLVLLKANNEEEYYLTTPSQLSLVGEISQVDYLHSGKQAINYTPAKKIISLPYPKGQLRSQTFTASLLMAKKDISIPFIYENFDSLKILIKITEASRMRDDGLIAISKDSNPAIEIATNIISNFTLFLKQKNSKKWDPYVKLDPYDLPKSIIDKFLIQKHERIDILNPSFKGVYITYEISDKQVRQVEFQDLDLDPSSINISYSDQGVIALPNPSFGPIKFQLFNHETGDYKLEIYNVVGKPIFSKKYTKSDGRILEADLSSLRRGTYLYSIIDSTGRKIATKRISLINI
jgi:hypothetical protein